MPKALVKYYFVASIIENHGSAALSLIGLSQTKYEAHFPNDFRIMCLIFLGNMWTAWQTSWLYDGNKGHF